MKVYLVGGAVRDELMGLTPKDRDYVVVGSTPEELLALGYKQVGASFPVFLHPETGEEYALARTEKSTGETYGDFDVYFGKDVTIEQDLERRDLTINSIAKDLETGEYIDPFNGIQAIKNKYLVATSSAFMEDPVRALRLYRFQATLGRDWRVEEKTYQMAEVLLSKPENFTAERIWKELHKVLETGKFFSNFLWVLSKLYPEIAALYKTEQNPEHHPEGNVGIHTALSVEQVLGDPITAFAVLCHDFGKPAAYIESDGRAINHEFLGLDVVREFCDKLRVPKVYRDLAMITCHHHTRVHSVLGRGPNRPMKVKSIAKLFQATRAFNQPERFKKFLLACEADANGRGFEAEYPQAEFLRGCLEAYLNADTSFTKGATPSVDLGMKIEDTRREAIREYVRNV